MLQEDEFCILLVGLSFLGFFVHMERTHFFMFCLYHPCDLRFDSGTSANCCFNTRVSSFICPLIIIIIFLKTLKDYLKTYKDQYAAVLAFRPTGESYTLANFELLNYWHILFVCCKEVWNWNTQYFSILFISPGWTYSETIGNQLDLIKPSSKGNVTIFGEMNWSLQF